jgi:glutathione S-transferase
MPTLIYSPGSCAMASHIALEETGAPYETRKINFRNGEQTKPDYLAINPKGRVPALITERGVLTETPAILAYVAQTNPKAKLAPLDDPFAFADLQAFNAFMCATVHVNHAHKARGYRWADDEAAKAELARKTPLNLRENYEMIDSKMIKGPYVMGQDYTIADIYLFTLASWLPGQGLQASDFPKVDAIVKAMSERPAVKKVVAIHAAG